MVCFAHHISLLMCQNDSKIDSKNIYYVIIKLDKSCFEGNPNNIVGTLGGTADVGE